MLVEIGYFVKPDNAWRSNRILKMCDVRLCPRSTFHCNNVDLPVVDLMLCRVMLRRRPHMFLLPRGNRNFRRTQAARGARLDLDEDGETILLGDDIDLAVRSA